MPKRPKPSSDEAVAVPLPFPVGGVSRALPVAQMPPEQTTDALNVVSAPSISDSLGGGSRDGTVRAFAEQLSGTGTSRRVNHLLTFLQFSLDLSGGGGPPTHWEDLGLGLGDAGIRLGSFTPDTLLHVLHNGTTAGGVGGAERFSRYAVDTGSWDSPTPAFDTGSTADPACFLLWDDGVSGVMLYAVGGKASSPAFNQVERWNGTIWENLSGAIAGGISSLVHSIAVYNGALYICGDFTTIGGSTRNRLAKWDGPGTTTWSAVGQGLNGRAYSLEVYNGKLYIGGAFTQATQTGGGTVAVRQLVSWDGTSFASLASSGPVAGGPIVMCLRTWNSLLYIGGAFKDVQGTRDGANGDHDNITSWNGTKFIPLLHGLRGPTGDDPGDRLGVRSMEIWNDGTAEKLWVAGVIAAASTADGLGIAIPSLCAWDGTAWTGVRRGIAGGAAQVVRHMVPCGPPNGQKLYATGAFTSRNHRQANGLAAWNGLGWLGVGGAGQVYLSGSQSSALAAGALVGDASEKLYASGYANPPVAWGFGAGEVANYIAAWDGAAWHAMQSGLGDFGARALHIADLGAGTRLYAGGDFTTAGSLTTSGTFASNRLAAWTGTAWEACLSGVNGTVYALADMGGKLYVCGAFSKFDPNTLNTTCNKICTWDGVAFAVIETGTDGDIYCAAPILVGGDTRIAIGGNFTQAGSNASCTRFAYTDGASFTDLGSGFNGIVRAVAYFGGRIYAAGDFTASGAASVAYVAFWDGAAWQPLGAGLNERARALLVFDDGINGERLYVSGRFTTAGGLSCLGVAAWTGSSWVQCEEDGLKGFAAADGNAAEPTALGAFGGVLHACGHFNFVGGEAAYNVAEGRP